MFILILLVLALLAFAAGAVGVKASVSWDQLGKAFLTAALLAHQAGAP